MAVATNAWVTQPRFSKENVARKASKGDYRRGTLNRSYSMLLRFCIWYLIYTLLTVCPTSVENLSDESPSICKPYIAAQSHIKPYLQPYYDTYAANYVDTARPYLRKLDSHVISPAKSYAKFGYAVYGAPRVEKARIFGKQKWDEFLRPQIDQGLDRAKAEYIIWLAPHINSANQALQPYYNTAKESSRYVYFSFLLPAYESSIPHLENSYNIGYAFVVEHGIPYASWLWSTVVTFIERTLWPKARILYGQNVEPQLIRFGERLGRYRDQRKLEAVVKNVESFQAPDEAEPSAHSEAKEQNASLPAATPGQEEEQAREKIANDLKAWQEKFARAADKGAEDLEQRVRDITTRQIDSQIQGVGEALVIQLEETVKNEVEKLQTSVSSIIEDLSTDRDIENRAEKATRRLSGATRAAGLAIRDRALALRAWKQTFDQETHSLVNAASESTLDIIDNIRDLGLQEIGMRWAWMEGVTYKDWSKYHELRKTFDEWRSEVLDVANGHPDLIRATEKSGNLEDRGMAIAEEAAKKLITLKEMGKLKIESQEFPPENEELNNAPLAQKILSNLKDGSEMISESLATAEEVLASHASAIIPNAAAKISGLFAEDATTQSVSENLFSINSQKIESASSSASSIAAKLSSSLSVKILGTPQPVPESLLSVASESVLAASASASSIASQLSSTVSEKVYGKPQPVPESLLSIASESVSAASASASSIASQLSSTVSEKVYGKPQPVPESLLSIASESVSAASASASSIASQLSSTVSEKVYGKPQPLSDSLISVASESISAASTSAISIISKAFSPLSEKVLGTPQPLTESLLSAASNSVSSLSKALLQPDQPVVQSVLSAGSKKLESAISDASKIALDTSKPIHESLTSKVAASIESLVSAAGVSHNDPET
ncbi:MAG: hypothetical protein M1829_005713 [Trizodia sp. TS-e1964]|nr:MAG: hypothetical protein M1829_005713 [Trizodia sp. TS-e1964]